MKPNEIVKNLIVRVKVSNKLMLIDKIEHCSTCKFDHYYGTPIDIRYSSNQEFFFKAKEFIKANSL